MEYANLTPSKRPLEEQEEQEEEDPSLESSIPSKSQKSDSFPSPQKERLLTYKILCPLSQSGSVIGKGGEIVSKIREQTGAKIKLQEAIRGCDERIVVITSYHKSIQNNQIENENNEEREIPPAFVALMRVFERVVNLTFDINGEEEEQEQEEEREEDVSTMVTFRMLILSSQVGSILGKNGVIIKRIMAESGAQIRIMSRDILPYCANTYEDVIQINGAKSHVRNALKSIAEIILDRPIRDSSSSSSSTNHKPPAGAGGPSRKFAPRQFGAGPSRVPSGPPPGPPMETMTYKMLCTNDKVGGIIGKGGHVVKNIKNETGTDVVISELVPASDSQDRMISLSGPAYYDDGFSPVQTAVMRVLHRLIHGGSPPVENRNGECRIIIPANQIGCLLGKGGGIITDMRKSTKAFIRILTEDQHPLGLEDNSKIIQINGNAECVEQAMAQITTRLKHNFMKDKMPPHSSPFGPPPYGEMEPPFGGWMPPPPPQGFHAPPPPFEDRFPPWGPQGREPIPEYHAGPPIRAGGFPREENIVPQQVIQSVNLEVVIPRVMIPNLIGEDGEGCLKQIRETSEAKITITEPRPESTETVILVYGVPEHAYCAKSLLQAFVLCEIGTPFLSLLRFCHSVLNTPTKHKKYHLYLSHIHAKINVKEG